MKIYYINKNSSKCILSTSDLFSTKGIRLYSFYFLPYIHLFHGSTQLYLIYLSILIMAIIAASQSLVGYKSKKDKMKAEIDDYNLKKSYETMLDEKYHSNISNATTSLVKED